MCLGSYLILAVVLGARNQSLANRLFAEIWARCYGIGIILSDGWRSYYGAVQRCFGRIYQPRKSACSTGRKASRVKFNKDAPFFAQVIKETKARYKLSAVKCRAVIGKMRECLYFID